MYSCAGCAHWIITHREGVSEMGINKGKLARLRRRLGGGGGIERTFNMPKL